MSIKKDITDQRNHFALKNLSGQSYGFSSRCESWSIKMTEHWIIDAFELWCWRRLLKVPWTARRSNQSILKEIIEYSLEGLTLKLKLQYFGHLIRRAYSLEKYKAKQNSDAGKDWRQEEKEATEDEMIGPDSMDMSLNKLWWWWRTESLACCSPWSLKELVSKTWQLNNNF